LITVLGRRRFLLCTNLIEPVFENLLDLFVSFAFQRTKNRFNNSRSKYAITQMLTQEPLETASRGKIVNIASVTALIGEGHHSSHSASKAAVVNLTLQLAVTFGPRRINVNAVCPGFIPTAMTRPTNAETEKWHRGALQATPWPRFGTPQDVTT